MMSHQEFIELRARLVAKLDEHDLDMIGIMAAYPDSDEAPIEVAVTDLKVLLKLLERQIGGK